MDNGPLKPQLDVPDALRRLDRLRAQEAARDAAVQQLTTERDSERRAAAILRLALGNAIDDLRRTADQLEVILENAS